MLNTCKYSNCAVCKSIEERAYFSSIYETLYPEVVLCEHAMYQIKNADGWEFLIPSIEYSTIGKYGCYIHDMFTEKNIYLTHKNLKILCTSKNECQCKPYVKEYTESKKKAAD